MATHLHLIYFSPTQTTRLTLEAISEGFKPERISHHNLTDSSTDQALPLVSEKDFVILGVPVYGGRVPDAAVHRLKKISGQNTPAALVVVYGNREYDDALLEFKDIILKQGFLPVAAAAFIGEHSFSSKDYPIAQNRPDWSDKEKAKSFGTTLQQQVDHQQANKTVDIPGDRPYRKKGNLPDMAPITEKSACDACGVCVTACPTDAITLNDTASTRRSACILCCACIKKCPNNARYMDNEVIKDIRHWLSSECSERKEPEFFTG